MNQHTIAAKSWLDRRYSRKDGGEYLAHQPIYGISTDSAEPNAVLRFARSYRLLERLHELEFDSVLDAGGGEGYLAALVRDLFSTPVAHSSDLSAEACRRAGEIFDIQGAGADVTRLPFADKSYDLVICSEVIEHLSRPVAAIAELARIARKYVVITTSEFCPTGELERQLRIRTLDTDYAHSEMNWFTAADFRGLLGKSADVRSQYRNLEHLLPSIEWNRERVEKALDLLTVSDGVDVDHAGVVVLCAMNGAAVKPSRITRERKQQILDRLLEPQIARRGPTVPEGAPPAEAMLQRLRCIRCGAVKLDASRDSITCLECAQTYEMKGGVPSMFVDGADDDRVKTLDEECVSRLGGTDAGRQREVRAVIDRLHHPSKNIPAWQQKMAAQLLRVLWLYSRDEAFSSKVSRLIGQLTGRPPVGSAEVSAALLQRESGRVTGDQLPQRQGVSRI